MDTVFTVLGGLAALTGIITALVKFVAWMRRTPGEDEPPSAPGPDPQTVKLVEEAVLELGELEDLLSRLQAMVRARPYSVFRTPRGKQLFQDLEERGNSWNIRSQPLRWRIEGTDAGHAFDSAMTAGINYFNCMSMIKMEGADLHLRMDTAAKEEVQGYIQDQREASERHRQEFESQVRDFRSAARTIAGLEQSSIVQPSGGTD